MALTKIGKEGITGISNSANATAITISADEEVTMPLQPCFSVTKSATQTNIAVGSDVVITFDTEVFDVGANFASNTFTAPVTGKYQINTAIRVAALDSAASYYVIHIVTSNRSYSIIYDPDFGQGASFWSFVNSAFADLDANDTAQIKINQADGTQQTDVVHTISWCQFNGALIC